MFLIIEGPTCSGKSTLYGHVLEHLKKRNEPVTMVHMDRPRELNRRWVLNEYVNRWQWYDGTGTILADRWHFGEATYAPIYRPDTNKDGYGLLGKAGWRWTELFLKSRGAVIAKITARPETLVERLESRGDDHVRNSDELLEVAKLYEEAVVESPATTITFRTDDKPNPSHMAFQVLQLAAITQEYHYGLLKFPEYIGPRRPSVLLVGDKRNITKRYGEETKLPFMPVDGNSGEYLLNALPDWWWHLCGLVNGNECSNLRQLWVELGRPNVAALGGKADDACKAARVPHARFYHPQYVRRFKNADQKEYGEMITTGMSN